MSRARSAAAAVVAVLALSGAACGSDEAPLRVAVQVECQGFYESFADAELAGAFLPLLERGARLSGRSLRDGVEDVSIAGRPVEVRSACTETFEPRHASHGLRELVEEWRPHAVIGSGVSGQDGLIVRDIGRGYPDVAFVVVMPSVQQVTLEDRAPNVVRTALDNAQTVAGLGEYAYRTLGWRRAVVVVGPPGEIPTADDWEQAAGFMAEFCALGGTATLDDGRAWIEPAAAAERYARTADGVAVLPSWLMPTTFLQATARKSGVASRLVLGGWTVENHANLTVPGADLEGVAVGSTLPLDAGPESWRRYLESFAGAYPSLPKGTGSSVWAVRYRNGMEALVAALERIDGDPGADGLRLREALASGTVATVPARSSFDEHGQAVTSVYLSRLGRNGVRDARTVSEVRGVEQTFGGIFGPESTPTQTKSSCDRGATPPPWAR